MTAMCIIALSRSRQFVLLRIQGHGGLRLRSRFQLFDRQWLLLLNIAEAAVTKKRDVMLVRSFPCQVVGRSAKCLLITGTSRERKHGDWLTHPDALRFQLLLPAPDGILVVRLSEDQVRLHPWNPGACVNQQLCNALGRDVAVLIQLVPAFVG